MTLLPWYSEEHQRIIINVTILLALRIGQLREKGKQLMQVGQFLQSVPRTQSNTRTVPGVVFTTCYPGCQASNNPLSSTCVSKIEDDAL